MHAEGIHTEIDCRTRGERNSQSQTPTKVHGYINIKNFSIILFNYLNVKNLF